GCGYCTEFLIEGRDLEVEKIREQIAALGDSVLVVGEPELVKVHVHTDDPSRVINLASGFGRLARLNVGDMSTQHRRIREAAAGGPAEAAGPPSPRANGVGLVAVAAGKGLVEIFRGLGVDAIVEGGQTMNPSTQDMLRAVESLPYDEVILLPNNGNVILAAREVGAVTKKQVHLVETHSMPAGISAAIAFSPERQGAENAEAMKEAAARVQTIEVTHAVRDTRSNGVRVKKGDVICLVNERLQYAGGEYGEVVRKAIEGIDPDSYELITVYRGEGATDSESERLEKALKETFPRLAVEFQAGGQQHYPFILSVE
ncbi:MAG TPA: hypothetical protein VK131_01560, partial [Candidatus Acidoferrales bacterium]|nr:hypothetical protein [Candidatus Acidoferrales bacterium]